MFCVVVYLLEQLYKRQYLEMFTVTTKFPEVLRSNIFWNIAATSWQLAVDTTQCAIEVKQEMEQVVEEAYFSCPEPEPESYDNPG